jgi:hypothetical protein
MLCVIPSSISAMAMSAMNDTLIGTKAEPRVTQATVAQPG